MELRPDLPQVACFDTAFHRGHPDLADCYAIPRSCTRQGFGATASTDYPTSSSLPACGSSHPRFRRARDRRASGKRRLDVRAARRPLRGLHDGLHRARRAAHGHALRSDRSRRAALSPGATADVGRSGSGILYRDCGLKGLSGISNDVRELLASDDPRARFALDYFAYQVGRLAGSLAAVLGGLDGFVFTAGIGENAPVLRALIAERLAWLGMKNSIPQPMITARSPSPTRRAVSRHWSFQRTRNW